MSTRRLVPFLSSQEELQLALSGVHSQAQRDDRRYRADIKAEVAHKWPGTAAFLQEAVRNHE